LSPDTRKGETPDQLTRRIDAAIHALQLVRADIDLLWRIGQHPAADPYPSNLRPADGSTSTTSDTPVERAALTDHTPHDPVGQLVEEIFFRIANVDTTTHHIEGRRQLIHRYATKHFGRLDTTSTCEICDRTVAGTPQDRLRSGMCQADYTAWRRYCDTTSEPSREQFARIRRDEQRQAS
jgi:hypothetical protein